MKHRYHLLLLLLGGIIVYLGVESAALIHRIEMNQIVDAEALDTILYPAIEPHDSGYLAVSPFHKIWYATYGNPKGIPVVLLHNGPGISAPTLYRYIDPKEYRIITFDQRGVDQSKAKGILRNNTTDDLIHDIEKLRQHLSVKQWVVFGTGWGGTLALAYGEAYPESTLGFIVQGVLIGIKQFREGYLLQFYHKRLFSPEPKVHFSAADMMVKILTRVYPNEGYEVLIGDQQLAVKATRILAHYSMNNFFIDRTALMNHLSRIQNKLVIIIQGDSGIMDATGIAKKLHQALPSSELILLTNTTQSYQDPKVAEALKNSFRTMKKNLH